jgi:hypothetical protein
MPGALVTEDAATDRLGAVKVWTSKVGVQRDLVNAAAESSLQKASEIGVALGLCDWS